MVEVASRAPVAVGSIAWPKYRSASTLIVKTTFDLRADGSVTLAHYQPALSRDVRTRDGALVYPSDFAPHKTLVDVVVVGEEARMADASLVAGPLRVASANVGPIASHDLRDRAWSDPSFDATKFQIAPAAQRVPRVAFPIELAYARGGVTLHHRVDLPSPTLMIVEEAGDSWSSADALSVHLTCDALLLDPTARKLTILHRGFAELCSGFGPKTLVLVNPFGRLEGVQATDIATWPRSLLAAFEAEDSSADSGKQSTVGVAAIAQADANPRATVALTADAIRGAALPFAAGAAAPERAAFAASPSAPPPSAPRFGAPPPSAPGLGHRPSVMTEPMPQYIQKATLPFAQGRYDPIAPQPGAKLTVDEVRAIQRELAAAPGSRAETLRRHGLTEAAWGVVLARVSSR